MSLHLFTGKKYRHTHERQALRKVIDSLEQLSDEEDLFLFVNALIPETNYTSSTGRVRHYANVQPDLILLKQDAMAVIEMKSYSGLIRYPLSRDDVNGPWTCEKGGKVVVINEGNPSPFSQISHNKNALVGFLQEHEEDLGDDDVVGCLWYKATRIVLFTESDTTLDSEVNPAWINTYVACFDFPDPKQHFHSIVADLTTRNNQMLWMKNVKVAS